MTAPPDNSRISLEYLQGQPEITIPQPHAGTFRYCIGIFMAFWLGGWAMGWKAATTELLQGTKGPDLFMFFWLGAWTVGGILAMYFLYRLFRPSVPEKIILSYPAMIYDTGVPPLNLSFSFGSQMDIWKKMFQKRRTIEFDSSEIMTLSLREFDSGNRLTIDHGSERYDLAAGASEPEREWLFGILKEHYRI